MLDRTFGISVFAIIFVASSASGSDFPTLVSKVPGSANSIVLIDADAVLASPIAKANGWEKRYSDGSADRPLYLPPEADKVVVAAQLDQVRGFTQSWEVALMGMKEPFSMSLVARAEGGYADTINGVKVAWVPSDAYFIEVDPQTLGLMAPANRQAIARWADRATKPATAELSEFLTASTKLVGQGAQVVMAIDTTDAIQAHRVQTQLEKSDLAKSLDVASTVQLISGMKGLVLQIAFTDKVQATAIIEFSNSVTLTEAVAKQLVLKGMDTMQMSLPGTEKWTCRVSGNSIAMSGELETDALRRVFSLLEIPSTKFSSLKDENTESSSQDDIAKNSLAYFKSVNSLLTDLRARSKSSGGGNDAYWIDRYAIKIDKLPILHVDDDLLEYGEKLSETLHIMSGARKITTMQGAAAGRSERASEGYSTDDNGSGYGYGSYSYTSPRTAERNAGNARADAQASGTSVKIQGWKLIDEATQQIRREMTKRYDLEF